MIKLLEELSRIPCPPGGEAEMHGVLAEMLKPQVDEILADPLGNLIAWKRGPAGSPTLMLIAHIDEVALMISGIDPTGLLRFEKMGWIEDRHLTSRLVEIHTRGGPLTGVVGSPATGPDDRGRVLSASRLFIDVGAVSETAAGKLGVETGDLVTFAGRFVQLPGGLVTCRAVDDRAGTAALVSVMAWLGDRSLDYSVAAVFASQHEIGLRGPATAGFAVDPDACLVVDVSGNFPELGRQPVLMGGGPVFRAMEEYGTDVAFGAQKGLLASRALNDLLRQAARDRGIPCQMQVRRGSIGDGTAVHLIRGGVATASILFPVRYTHTCQEVVDPADLQHVDKLLKEVMSRLDAAFIAGLGTRRL